jgi:hypothetical protein
MGSVAAVTAADAERLAGVGGIGSGVSASILKAIGAKPRADPAAQMRCQDTASPLSKNDRGLLARSGPRNP